MAFSLVRVGEGMLVILTKHKILLTTGGGEMSLTLAFDVYGTLIDTQGVSVALEKALDSPALAAGFARCWREKQLEYSFRRGLMGYYAPFSTCIRDALDWTDRHLKTGLDTATKDQLLKQYAVLPAFPDAKPALASLKAAGVHCVAFSNGTREAVEGLLTHAGIVDDFQDLISVDAVKRFKPDPAVYAYLRDRQASSRQLWLVSSNPFDVIGAAYAGLNTAWVQRDPEVPFDGFGAPPDLTVDELGTLVEQLTASGLVSGGG